METCNFKAFSQFLENQSTPTNAHVAQPGILLPPPNHARYLSFSLGDRSSLTERLLALRDWVDGEKTVVGF